MSHFINETPSGAECSCGREFNVWKLKLTGYVTSQDHVNKVPLVRANARRHALAANAKEAN